MKLFDLHNDALTELENPIKVLGTYDKDIEVVTAIYKGNLTFKKAETIAKTLKNSNLKNTYLAFEDISFSDLDLDRLIDLKPLYCSITYNGENEFGYGVNEDKNLKNKGKELVKILDKNGIFIDTAHLSSRGILDVLNVTNRVLNSHSLFNSVYNHKRNLTDFTIKEIVSIGGIIGVNFVGYFLSERNATHLDVFKHIDYFVNRFSINNLAIGTDFNGTDNLPKGLESYEDFYNLINVLLKSGYSNEDINKILYTNAKNFFNR